LVPVKFVLDVPLCASHPFCWFSSMKFYPWFTQLYSRKRLYTPSARPDSQYNRCCRIRSGDWKECVYLGRVLSSLLTDLCAFRAYHSSRSFQRTVNSLLMPPKDPSFRSLHCFVYQRRSRGSLHPNGVNTSAIGKAGVPQATRSHLQECRPGLHSGRRIGPAYILPTSQTRDGVEVGPRRGGW
jgi:hypothetical protein